MPRSPELLLGDVLRHSRYAISFVEGETYDSYARDVRLRLSTQRCLIIVGEALRHLVRQQPEFLLLLPDGRKAIGLRNHLVHEYHRISDQVVWSVILNYLPNTAEQIEALLEDGFPESEEEWHE